MPKHSYKPEPAEDQLWERVDRRWLKEPVIVRVFSVNADRHEVEVTPENLQSRQETFSTIRKDIFLGKYKYIGEKR